MIIKVEKRIELDSISPRQNEGTIVNIRIREGLFMNNFELRCYLETYNAPHYWEGKRFEKDSSRQKSWQECRQVTDNFYDELVIRGYLTLKDSQH